MFGKKSRADELAIFFATDVHGSNVCFKKFINAGKFYGVKVLILGGDVTGKMVVPIAKQPDGSHLTSFAGKEVRLDGADSVNDFVRRISDMGFYPSVMTEDEFRDVKAKPERQEQLFHELIRKRLDEWVEFAQPRLAESGIRCFAAPGNDDGFFVDEIIQSSGVIELLEMRVIQLDGMEILSTGWSNQTPWHTERECTEPELKDRLMTMIGQMNAPERGIFNIHVPPHKTNLDQCPQLDDQLRPVSDGGNPVMTSAGSTAVRELIETYQPVLGLHGHIHEGRGKTRIGRTTCVNPGSNYSEGVLNGSLIRLSGGQVQDVQLTQG
jgi:Icc-related predicted phosphoesterase